ncbi:Krr1 family protein [Cooperia oncophora]
MSKMKLLDSDDDDEDVGETSNSLEINKNYAERYDNWRRLEELQKIKDKYGDNLDDTSSSEEEPEWSAADEMQFLKTLSALKDNDSAIYDGTSSFWHDSGGDEANEREKAKKKDRKPKPMYLKDYERKLILEKGGQIDESDEEDEQKGSNYFEQQEQIRNELRRVVESNDDGNVSDESDDLLVPKVKTKEEKEAEDNDFYSWMKSQDSQEVSDDDSLKGLKKAWKDPNIDEGEKFLRDYILNKDFIPEAEDKAVTVDDLQEIEEDEKMLDMQRNFEQKYNFRFEDPDQEFIKQYPRTVGDSLRQSNTKRKTKREEYKERKEREKNERKQEIRELKNMKKAEIEKKLDRLKKMAGDDIPINIDDITGDFDPREYDKRMEQIFNEEYYGKDDSVHEQDAEKPVFSDIDSDVESDSSDYDNFPIGTISDDVSSAKNDEQGQEKNEGVSDEITRSSGKPAKSEEKFPESRRKMKRNSKFREAVRRKKPLFDPNEKTFEEYFNEYYALNYEDIIGDHLTRFKYRQVVPNDFGLSVGEILSADDRQLNAWASLKKATGYRSEHEELVDVNRFKKKAADVKKKQRIFSTDFGGKKSKKSESQACRKRGASQHQ